MSLRFTETRKWEDGWYLSLSNDYRIIWQYVLDKCTIAGRWDKAFKLLNYCCNTSIDETRFKEVFSGRVIDKGSYFFIPKFLKVQYPKGIQSQKPAVVSVRKELLQYGLSEMVEELLGNDYRIIKDKDKDKDKETDKEKDKDKDKDKDKETDKEKDKDKDKGSEVGISDEEIGMFARFYRPESLRKHLEARGLGVESINQIVERTFSKVVAHG